MTRILMVCLGNICRSPLAHGILESKLPNDRYYVDSAGTANYHVGSSPDSRSIKVASNQGIDISAQRARQFKVQDFDTFDHIYVMDQSNYSDVIRLARSNDDIAKVKLILEEDQSIIDKRVPDPYYGDSSDFELVFNLLDSACNAITKRLS
ncbi:low molecular weight protein-tyrosine-phosphatase [Psychroserpens sp.]|uniref:low molecular weight protein-tyrosine-phosphatase n=1 Tax=Psychroserpens sp. TaxID=2020870 RepID=UPI001B29B3E1|nr:low molecular weight protein-tyrosine-phosphatase [Psychroserpens sp.]MBO6606821.1 low molecular weight phosphotyrosine protein phosphatase [Psychroserpens sp.]MBO6631134.1 low molecular weight phosphotyrosine protein phosphatase [Psychroserpens sp.]MBO6653524.1 low molecular weight phosphotyrosine protein phosphatase [Psychroserpens sp.]MBO6680448.1 low molecular weight phosphotyrosine protein phosphatase [Psychroserpens sp.]MBO6750593.1 low molecular weight phosphotyrosine protein phospha